MAAVQNSTSHEERTAARPREKGIETVTLKRIERINDTIRLMRLESARKHHTIKFLAGQWLDVFLPGLDKAGGFTITSTPRDARPTHDKPAHLELAVQKSRNPPAQWLWRPVDEILDKEIHVRVGGDFTWPPLNLDVDRIKRLVLVAGGVGINPLISILAHLMQQKHHQRPDEIVFLYGTKAGNSQINANEILFLPRLKRVLESAEAAELQLRLFLTGVSAGDVSRAAGLPPHSTAGRIVEADLEESLGEVEARAGTVCYVCGPQALTDTFVAFLASREGMSQKQVLCEKWW